MSASDKQPGTDDNAVKESSLSPADNTGKTESEVPTTLSAEKPEQPAEELHADTASPDTLPEPAAEPGKEATAAEAAPPEVLDPAQEQAIVEKIRERTAKLAVALENGSLSEAQSLSDRSHNALARLSGDIRQTLETDLAPLKAKLTEMLDWKRFADTEKKTSLVSSMQALVDADLPPPKKSRQIKALQEEWRTLGHAEDNDRLWAEFSDAARKAFEPCKVYFRERKELMRNNHIERTRICEQLEAYLSSIDDNNINVAEINKLESQARTQWKKFAPVAQNRIKQLQARFNEVLNALRNKRKANLLESARQKQALIHEAEQLVNQEDLQNAINRAKAMQQEWKKIGPAPFKDERRYWEQFRKACDALFARRNSEKPLPGRQSRSSKDKPQKGSTAGKRGPAARIDSKQQALLESTRARADFCQEIEDTILGDASADIDEQALCDTWTTLPEPGDKTVMEALQKRFERAVDAPQRQALRSSTGANETLARELCIEMEIQAGLPSPDEDRALRMQQQLKHLKQEFGQGTLSVNERAELLNRLKVNFLCIGPLTPAVRGQLAPRVDRIR